MYKAALLAQQVLQNRSLRKPLQVAGRRIGIAVVGCPDHPLYAFQHREGLDVIHSLPQNPGLP